MLLLIGQEDKEMLMKMTERRWYYRWWSPPLETERQGRRMLTATKKKNIKGISEDGAVNGDDAGEDRLLLW